jgi:hypothetical protein
MDPTVAALLRDTQGFKTKDELSKWLAENVEKTIASYFANGVVATGMAIPSLIQQGLEPYVTWSKSPPETLIKPFSPKTIQIVVVGGKIQTTWFVTDFRLSCSVSVDSWR